MKTSTVPQPPLTRPTVFGPLSDRLIAWAWLPLFVASHLLASVNTPAGDRRVVALLSLTLIFSAVHQPLTLVLVYGDAARFARHKMLFVLVPLIGAPIALFALIQHWSLLIPIAATWQIFHTLQQRYGFLRIQSRRAGVGSARSDAAVTWLPFLAAVSWVGATLSHSDQLTRFLGALGGRSQAAIRVATDALNGAWWISSIFGVLALVAIVASVRSRTARPTPQRAREELIASGVLLSTALAIDPVAGLIAMVGAHAFEYAIVTSHALARSRALKPARAFGLVFVLLFVFAGVLELLSQVAPTIVTSGLLLVVGLLHFTFDAVIWRLRRPETAAQLGLDARESSSRKTAQLVHP